MVTIDEIVSEETLRAWLKALPRGTEAEEAEARRIAVSVAARAAARIVPVIGLDEKQDIATGHPANLTSARLRSVLTATVASAAPEAGRKTAAAEAVEALSAALATKEISLAASSALSAARSASAPDLDGTFASAAKACATAYSTIANKLNEPISKAIFNTWGLLRNELQQLDEGQDPFLKPLWGEVNPLAQEFDRMQRTIAACRDAKDWAFWLWWYEGVLTGTAPDPDSNLMVEIATSNEIDWEDVPKALTAINAIWGRHGGDKPALSSPEMQADRAERAGSAAGTRVVDQVRQSVGENRKEIPATLEAVQHLILLEIERWQGNNFLNAEHPDLCRQQLQTYLVMYEALERIAPLIPAEGLPTVAETEKIVGLGQLYRDKFAALPREKGRRSRRGCMGKRRGYREHGNGVRDNCSTGADRRAASGRSCRRSVGLWAQAGERDYQGG